VPPLATFPHCSGRDPIGVRANGNRHWKEYRGRDASLWDCREAAVDQTSTHLKIGNFTDGGLDLGPGDLKNLAGLQNSVEEKVLKALIALSMPTLAILMPFAAQAADAGYCEAYAKAALGQVSVGHSHPACAAGMQGARWSPTFRVHFDYCISHPTEVVEGRQGARSEYLRSCGAIQ
jgi:hypothetical protein